MGDASELVRHGVEEVVDNLIVTNSEPEKWNQCLVTVMFVIKLVFRLEKSFLIILKILNRL